MKRIAFVPLLTLLVTVTALQSCNRRSAVFDPAEFVKGETLVDFLSEEEISENAYIANNYTNGGMFRSRWRKNCVRCENGIGRLAIYDSGETNYGAEIRTKQGYLYGYFGARLKTFKYTGTVQSLFTYNGGPHYVWDEIDIEFLGKDTRHVQFNYYSDGQGGHECWYDLGFDSSEDFHDYGFKWEKDLITWYVDFKPVYAAKAHLAQWGNFFVNVWAGSSGVNSWLGQYQKTTERLEAQYDYMCYAPLESAL